MKRFVGRLAIAGLVLALWTVTAGCEKDAPTLAHEGSIHLLQKQYPEAIAAFEAALALDPKSFEAQVGLAEVYTEKGDHAKAHEYFKKVYAGKLDKGRELYVDTRFQHLLLAEAEAMAPNNDEKYEAALRKVIDTRSRGQAADAAYEHLGKYYIDRGDALAKDKKTRVQAAEAYQQMNSIRTTPQLRTQALDKAEKLFREIYRDEFNARFAEDKAKWAEDSPWSEAGGRLTYSVAIEDKNLKFKDDEEKAPYQRKLSLTCQRDIILAMHLYSGTTPPDPLRNYKLETSKLESEVYEKGKAAMTVSVALEELEDLSYNALVKPARKKAAKAERAGKADDADGADGGDPKDDAADKEAPADPTPAEGGGEPDAAAPTEGAPAQ